MQTNNTKTSADSQYYLNNNDTYSSKYINHKHIQLRQCTASRCNNAATSPMQSLQGMHDNNAI